MTSDTLSSLLFDMLAKGVILFLLASVAIVLMRRASAAGRHFVWLCAVTGVLFLPLSAWLLPPLRALPDWLSWEQVRVSSTSPPATSPNRIDGKAKTDASATNPADLPEGNSEISEPLTVAAAKSEAPEPIEGIKVTSESMATPNRVESITVKASAETVESPKPEPPTLNSASAATEGRIPTQHTKSEAPAASTRAFDTRWLLVAWGIGCFVLLVPLMLSAVALRRTAARSRRLHEGPVIDHVAAIQQELGLRRPVRVFLSDERAMPMVWGTIRGKLLLPDEATQWSCQRLRTVLLHELSHLKRRDPIGLLVAHLALAIHWVNPLAWIAMRGLRAEQETACDDAVLRHGVRPNDYAAEMLAMTKQFYTPSMRSTALTMARGEMIEGRITGILDMARNRGALPRWVGVGVAILAAFIALPLAMLRATTQDDTDRAATAATEVDASFDQLETKLREIVAEPWKSDKVQRMAHVADQLAKLDPEKALALAQLTTRGHGLQLTSFSIRELTRKNAGQVAYNSLVKRVNALPQVDHRDAAAIAMVRAAAERDPADALKLLPRFRIRSDIRQIAIAEVLDDLIDRDLEKAAAFVADFDFQQMHQVRVEVNSTIARLLFKKKGLKTALAEAGSLKSLNDRKAARRSAINALMRAAPKTVVEELMSIKQPGHAANAWSETLPEQRRQILNDIYAKIARRDPAAARAWAENLPAKAERPSDWPPKPAIPETLEYALSLPEGSKRRAEILIRRIPKVAEDDPERAMTLSLELPTKQRNWIARKIAQAWAEKDVDSVVAFLDGNPRLTEGNGDILVETLSKLAQRNIVSAEAVVARSEKIEDDRISERVRESALRQIVYRFSPERAMELAGRLGKSEFHVAESWEFNRRKSFDAWMVNASPKHRAIGLTVLANASRFYQPRKAAGYLSELEKLELDIPLHYPVQTMVNVVRSYAAKNLEEAAEWAGQLENAASAPIATEMISRLWVVNNPGKAAKWISGLRKGAPRQSAALGFFAGLDPWNSELNWQAKPTAKQLKQQSEALIRVVSGLRKDDRAPAKIVLKILNNLEPAVKQRLLDELKQEETR